MFRNYDSWKLTSPDDERWEEFPPQDDEPEPPPCELGYGGRLHLHPRFPSGDCVVCGALCTEGCKHELAVGEYAPVEN